MNIEDNPMKINIPSASYSLPFRWSNGIPTIKALVLGLESIFSDGDDDGDDVVVHFGIDSATPCNVMSYKLLCLLCDSGILDDEHTVIRSDQEWVVVVDRIELRDMSVEHILFKVFNTDESWLGGPFFNALRGYCIDYKNLKVVFYQS